jgi:sugar lactone lactonase YvrE
VIETVKPDPFASGFGYVEGPRWHDGRLWVSDIADRTVLSFDESGAVVTSWETSGRPSGLGWLPTGQLLAVSMNERRVLRREGEEWMTHADLGALVRADINDMAVSRHGNAYVTGLGVDIGEIERRPMQIVLVRPDGSAEVQADVLSRPNGCIIRTDESRFVVAEARRHRLVEFDIGADGSLHSPRIFIELPSDSWADGICLDASDAIWVADPKGHRCFHVSAAGEIIDVIDTAPMPCVACTLGGSDGRTLFLLLTPLDDDFENLRHRKQARIDQVRVDIPWGGSP